MTKTNDDEPMNIEFHNFERVRKSAAPSDEEILQAFEDCPDCEEPLTFTMERFAGKVNPKQVGALFVKHMYKQLASVEPILVSKPKQGPLRLLTDQHPGLDPRYINEYVRPTIDEVKEIDPDILDDILSIGTTIIDVENPNDESPPFFEEFKRTYKRPQLTADMHEQDEDDV
jgi:hypothetical protein